MSDSVPDLPITLQASKTPTLGFLLASLGFTAYSVVTIRDGGVSGYYSAAFFACCSAVFVGLLHPRACRLTLTESGFSYSYYFRKTRFSWSQAAEFGVAKSGLGKKVGWNFQSALPGGEDRGFEGGFPDSYAMPAEELAELMERLRIRYAPKETD